MTKCTDLTGQKHILDGVLAPDCSRVVTSEERVAWQTVADALFDGSLINSTPPERFETHISLVGVDGTIVYKLKKPLVLAYLDYGTRARRKLMCEREVALNRRLAEDLYLGVRGVRKGHGGLELCDPDDASAIEHLVVMRYVSRSEMLDGLVDRSEVQPAQVAQLGIRLGIFHRGAERVGRPAGEPLTLMAWAEKLVESLAQGAESVLDPAQVAAATRYLTRWLRVETPLLEQRVCDGHIRDGHGDLRLEHVVMSDPVRVLDCVEFDDSLRFNDVLADLSFLVMELQLAGREDLTQALIRAWSDANEAVHDRLLWGYASSRALVRVEVALSRLAQLPAGLASRLVSERAQALLSLAIRLSWRAREPRAILFTGLSGSGKSSLSRTLAARWGLERHSSDETRKLLVGLGRSEIAPPPAFEDWVSKEVYERLGREAGREVSDGRSVVVDATFRRPIDAQAFVRSFRGAGALTSPLAIACVATDESLRARVRTREELGGADAGVLVLEAQLRERAVRPLGISDTHELTTDDSLSETLAAAELLVLELTVG